MNRLLTRCLCCDEAHLVPLIDFGPMPLANTYGVTEKFPLSVNRCSACFHLQLAESVDPAILFGEYTYFSGTSRTSAMFFRRFAEKARSQVPNAKTVLDIACNDGSQLCAFADLGLETHGIDPAETVLQVARRAGHRVWCTLFEDARFEPGTAYDILTAQNVIAHTPRPLEFLRKCRELMHDASRLFVTTSQCEMIASNQFDAIYHEHISYFNVRSMWELAKRANLSLLDVWTDPMHGNSYVFMFARSGEHSPRVTQTIAIEGASGLYAAYTYGRWKKCVKKAREVFPPMIEELRERGFFVVGCGAAAKGITFLNVTGVRLGILLDTTPNKWGWAASGMYIAPFETIEQFKAPKVAFVILAWNFEDEIRENVRRYRDNPKDVFLTTAQ